MTTNPELLSHAFVTPAAVRELGDSMASQIVQGTQRFGFMRTYLFHLHSHTVQEFTQREWHVAHRIKRRAPALSYRQIVREIRTHNI